MATRKTSTGKKSTSRTNKKVSTEERLSFSNEVTLLLLLAAGILLLISNFGFGGWIGGNISAFFFGLFGFMAYFFPPIPFGIVAFSLSNRKNKVAVRKIVAFVLFSFFLCCFVELVVSGNEMKSVGAAFSYGFAFQNGGGLIGGALALLFSSAFGLIGAYVISIIALIITMVLITERSFLGGVKKGSTKVYHVAKEEKGKHDLRKQARMEKKVSGVPIDTRIEAVDIVGSDDLVEIKSPVMAKPITSMPKILNLEPEIEEAPIKRASRKPKLSEAEKKVEVAKIEQEHAVQEMESKDGSDYKFPPINLLKKRTSSGGDSQKDIQETAIMLQETLKSFGIQVHISDVSKGPSVTRYEMQLEPGVQVKKIVSLSDDIKLSLAAEDIRIEAPIPGKAAIGIEVPNKEKVMVSFRDMVESEEFQKHRSKICFTVGKGISGQVIMGDIAKMPHLLMAGTTGSGKSICLNTIIMSILYKANPEDVKLILIDPKMVEFSRYNGIPHLFIPVVADPKKAAGALQWAVSEMSDRYQKFKEMQVRDLQGYNKKVEEVDPKDYVDMEDLMPTKLPQIVIVVDELADLMMVAKAEVETSIVRLAQLARAAGIHLILATQRPSVDVVTGLIKANMPSRLALSLSSGTDSRTIIDTVGAEKLLGNGDMLFKPIEYKKPLRIQGPFVSEEEVETVVDFLKKQTTVVYNTEIEEKISAPIAEVGGKGGEEDENRDPYFADAGRFIIEKEKGSIGMLQRWFKIGFNRAARIMDELADAGVVGPEEGTKPRRILMNIEEFEVFLEECA